MKKFTILILLAVATLSAVEWRTYEDAQKIAAKSCKPIALIVYRDDCYACKKLFQELDTVDLLTSAISNYEIAVISSADALSRYGTEIVSTPTIFILNNRKEELLRPIQGLPENSSEFAQYLNIGKAINDNASCSRNIK